MRHESKPQVILAKLMWVPMCLLFKGALRKAILKDLQDIKAVVEGASSEKANS